MNIRIHCQNWRINSEYAKLDWLISKVNLINWKAWNEPKSANLINKKKSLITSKTRS